MPDRAYVSIGRTVPELLLRRVEATPHAVAFYTRDPHENTWQGVTWSAHHAAVGRMARALARAGLKSGDRIGILAPTSMRWEIVQMAALARGAVPVGIDPNYPDDQLSDIVHGVGLSGLFVHNDATWNRFQVGLTQDLKFVASLYGPAPESRHAATSFDALMIGELGESTEIDADDCPPPERGAIIVFSSGTTGKPRPIEYSHAQVVTAVEAIVEVFPDIGEGSRLLCWLPLANLFQRMINFCAIARGASSYIISDPREVMSHISGANPHLLIGVPRFFERVHRAMQDRMNAAPTPVPQLCRWALSVGIRAARANRGAAPLHALDRVLLAIAERVALRRLRKAFGANLPYLVSGSAPMPMWLLEFFDAIGLRVYEAYGLSENIVPIAMNRPGMRKLGTVGRPLPINEVTVSSDGEIKVRGPGVFHGYWNEAGQHDQPDVDGFWGTGDLGSLDDDGFLAISGRKSDIFKTSTGQWVSPIEIEQELLRIPYIEHALVFGAGRKAPVALIGVDSGRAPQGAAETRDEAIRSDVVAATQGLATHRRPAGLLITSEAFSIAGGELTTNLKLRRKTVEAKYSVRLEQLYAALEQRAKSLPILTV